MEEFELAHEDRERVSLKSFLDVSFHALAILRSIFRHCDQLRHEAVDDYCVIALAAHFEGHADVRGDPNAVNRIVVLNHNDMHFDPCLRRSLN